MLNCWQYLVLSPCLQNFFLYFYGALFNGLAVVVVSIYKGITLGEMFEGQSTITYLLIANNAAQVRVGGWLPSIFLYLDVCWIVLGIMITWDYAAVMCL